MKERALSSNIEGGGSSTGQAIGFITEFNQNAQIFNERLAPLLDNFGASSDGIEGEDNSFEERVALALQNLLKR